MTTTQLMIGELSAVRDRLHGLAMRWPAGHSAEFCRELATAGDDLRCMRDDAPLELHPHIDALETMRVALFHAVSN